MQFCQSVCVDHQQIAASSHAVSKLTTMHPMRTEVRWGTTLQKLASAAGFVAVSLEDLRRLSTKHPTFHPNGHFADLILDPCTGKVNGQMTSASWIQISSVSPVLFRHWLPSQTPTCNMCVDAAAIQKDTRGSDTCL